MNAAAKALHHANFLSRETFSDLRLGRIAPIVFLTITFLLTAFALIYVKDLHRHYFSEMQTVMKVHDDLNVERGQLLLEQSTWTTQARIQNVAQQELGMEIPKAKEIKLISI